MVHSIFQENNDQVMYLTIWNNIIVVNLNSPIQNYDRDQVVYGIIIEVH